MPGRPARDDGELSRRQPPWPAGDQPMQLSAPDLDTPVTEPLRSGATPGSRSPSDHGRRTPNDCTVDEKGPSPLDRALATHSAGVMTVAGRLHAVSRGMELYTEDAVQITPDGTFEGRSAIPERLARELAACPDLGLGSSIFVEQDDTFADELTFAGTHRSVPAARRRRAPSDRRANRCQGHGAGECPGPKIVVDNLYYYNWPSRPSSVSSPSRSHECRVRGGRPCKRSKKRLRSS
jgi:hypothetical protein